MFKGNKKYKEKFVELVLEKYEDLMEIHFELSADVEEFDMCHKKEKESIITQLPKTWEASMGSKKMSQKIPPMVTEAIDQSFIQLRKHYEHSWSREAARASNQKAKDIALKHYTREMDKYIGEQLNVDIEKITIAHDQASMEAIGLAKTCEGVSVATVTELKDELENSFETYKTIAQVAEKSRTDPAIGIDLGTTMCCVTVFYNGKIEVIPNRAQGSSKTTPSYVAYQDDGWDTFGHVAKEAAYKSPENTIYDAKRMIGRLWTDENIQNDRKHWPFEVVEEQGHPKVETWGRSRYPHEVSARLLAQFRIMADEFLGLAHGSVSKAVITVPAYFTEPQRRATAEAAECAGLQVLNILSEPTAAAIAYSWERRDKEERRKCLIYDLGGGTFDVAVAMVESHSVEILAVDGDTHLGGQDFDQVLMNHCIWEFKEKEGVDLLEGKTSPVKQVRDGTRSALARLKLQCEKAKDRLSSSNKQTIDVERIHEDKHLAVVVTREKFEELVRPIVEKTLKIVDRALAETVTKGVLGKSDIDDVILVGGTTRVPLVASMLAAHFNGKQLCKNINPDEAVAFGAAIQAAILNNSDTISQIKVQDVTPMSLGLEGDGGVFCPVIPKNSVIPCAVTTTCVTALDDQTEMQFSVYQGECNISKENKLLGEFCLSGFPPMPAREEKALATMLIDVNGLLHIDAVAESTGNAKGITITSDRLAIDKEIKEKLQKEIQELALRHVS